MQRHDSVSARSHPFGLGARPHRSSRSPAMLLLLAVFFAALAGCDKGPARECDSRFDCPSPFVCDEGSSTCVDPSGGVYCSNQASCTNPEKAFCFVEAGICVPCVTQGSNNECADRLICSGQRTCLACVQDADCIGNSADEETLCLRTGGCAAQKDVAYVAADGADNTTCLEDAPCTSLVAALATNRPYIRLRGDITLGGTVVINHRVTIHGTKTERLTITSTADAAIFDIQTSDTVELRDLEISRGMRAAIQVTSGSPKLDLDNVDIIGNNGVGIIAGTAALHVQRSLIVGNGGGGITATAAVNLENNIIVGNGGPTSTFGGLQLTSNSADNIIRFNTFAANQAQNAATGRSVTCSAPLSLSSNIFADGAPQVATCTTTYSLYPVGSNPGATNKVGNPMFEVTTPAPSKIDPERDGFRYYHILEGSPAVDSAEPLGDKLAAEDFEGDPRGTGTTRDIGADEIYE